MTRTGDKAKGALEGGREKVSDVLGDDGEEETGRDRASKKKAAPAKRANRSGKKTAAPAKRTSRTQKSSKS